MEKKKKRLLKIAIPLALILQVILGYYTISNEVQAIQTSNEKNSYGLSILGKKELIFSGEGTYAFNYFSNSNNDKEVHKLYLPKGVELDEQTFNEHSVGKYDASKRTLTLKQTTHVAESIVFSLKMDLKKDTNLIVTIKNQDGQQKTDTLRLVINQEKTSDTLDVVRFPKVLSGTLINVSTSELEIIGTKALVYNWVDFLEAMTNKDVFHIELQNHIVIPETTNLANEYRKLRNNRIQPPQAGNNGSSWLYAESIVWRNNINIRGNNATFIGFRRNNAMNPQNEKVVIDGQGKYAIDNGNITLTWHDGASHEYEMKDLTIYTGNYYGWMTFNDLSDAAQRNSRLIYNNYIAKGTQMSHSPQTPVTMKGYVANIHDDDLTYRTPLRTPDYWDYNTKYTGYQESNLYAKDLEIEEGAQVYLSSTSTGNIDLNGRMVVKKGAMMFLNSSFIGQILNGTSIESGGGILDDSAGSNIKLDGVDAQIILEDSARVFLYGDETKATRGGAILMRSRESKIKIGHGAALEIYQTGANGQVLGAYNQATIIAMNAGATIDVEDYGRFSLFADKMEDGFSPIYFYGNAQINIGKNGIFDLVADTSNSLMHTRGAANQSASINFSDAYRVNIHRFGDKNKYTTRSLFSHQQANGDTVINATSQQLFQWDNGYDSMLEGINIEKQDTLLPEFHEEAIPTGQSFVTNLTFTQNDEGYSRAFAPVYSIRSTFKGTNSNAVNTNIRTFKASDKQNLERQFGRSSFAFDNNTATTNGSKPNRILYGKVFDLEVQLFSTLTDNNTKQQAIYDGSVTQSYLKQGEDGFITDDKGNYIPFDPSENPQAQLIQYDPRKEIIGRVGSTIEKMSYNPITKKMEQKTVFIPLEQAYVKLLANGSVNPLTNAFVDKYNGKNKPQATQTIPTIDLTPEALEGSNFSDLKYSVLSSNENGITIPSSGQTVSGKGYFLYELDKDSDLVAQDLIKVMAYLDGKEFTYGIKAHLQSLKVFDETSPQAQPKNGAKDKDTALAINISQEIELPSPSYFVEKVNDSNPYSNLDGFFSYQYDFTPPVSPIESTTPITSEEMFKEFLGSYDIDEQTKYSIGIRVSDYAGNIIRVDTVVFRITKAQIQPQLSDLYIYKSDLQKYKMTQNEQLMKNWLVQQGIKSINYQVKDDKNNLLIEKDYEPSKKFDTKTHLFKVENMDGLFNNQEIGKIYQIEAILLAKKANPTLKPDKGITSDYPVQFKIMVIDDTLSINATKPLNFGNHLISAQTRQENYELTENTQLIEIQDSVGKYDTKDGKLTDEELEINDKGEKEIIRTGKIKDISSIKKTPNKQALQTWKVTAELSKPFQTSQGKLLNASIEFEQGNLISASDTENFEVKKSIFYNGSSIVLVDGNLGGNYLFTKGKNQIDFAKDQVTLHVPLAEKKLGDFTGELTYTLISSPNK